MHRFGAQQVAQRAHEIVLGGYAHAPRAKPYCLPIAIAPFDVERSGTGMGRAECRGSLERRWLWSTGRPPPETQGESARRLELSQVPCRLHDEGCLVFSPIAIAVASSEKQSGIRQDDAIELRPGLGKDDRLGRAVEILQDEPRVLFSSLLRDLPFDAGDHRAHADLMFAPFTEGRGGSRSEELDLLAIPFQRMAGDEEAENFLLLGKPLGLSPRGKVGQGGKCGKKPFRVILPVFPVIADFSAFE